MITIFLSDHYLKDASQNSCEVLNSALQEVRSKNDNIYLLETVLSKKRWFKRVEYSEYELFNVLERGPINKCHVIRKLTDKNEVVSFLNNLSEVL